MITDALKYYETAQKNDLDLLYSGPLWADGIEGLAGTLRRCLEFENLPLSISQSVFSVFVEQMNNMLMYSEEKKNFQTAGNQPVTAPKGVFILGIKDKTYFVQSGNVMKKECADLIKNRIDHLNTLDKEGLRKFYREKIKGTDDNPKSKGAGIGLIEIAKRSKAPIEYDFQPYGDGLVFFTMFVTIG